MACYIWPKKFSGPRGQMWSERYAFSQDKKPMSGVVSAPLPTPPSWRGGGQGRRWRSQHYAFFSCRKGAVCSRPRLEKGETLFFLIFKTLKNFIYLFNLWLHQVSFLPAGFSLVAASGSYSSLQCTGFALRWLLLLWSMGSGARGLQQVWRTGVPCIGRQILNHWTTREV